MKVAFRTVCRHTEISGLKSRRFLSIFRCMTITGQSAMTLLDSVVSAASSRFDMNVAVLKKTQDVEKQQGEAMVEMLEQSVTPSESRGLDTYA
jgi:hypothetical protein